MASSKNTLKDFQSNPELDQCTGRLLSLANQLLAEGYKPRTVARGALNAGLEVSRINLDDHRPFLRLLGELNVKGIRTLDEAQLEAAGEAL